jgi:hypothetical protein
MGRPREDGVDAIQAIFDDQTHRVFERLFVGGLVVGGLGWRRKLARMRYLKKLASELNDVATEFISRK